MSSELETILEFLESLSQPGQLTVALGVVQSFVIQYIPGWRGADGNLKRWVFIGLSLGLPLVGVIVKLVLWQLNGLAALDTALIVTNAVMAFGAGLTVLLTGTGFFHLTFDKEDDDAERPDAPSGD